VDYYNVGSLCKLKNNFQIKKTLPTECQTSKINNSKNYIE
jgi:hypothetical protein